MAQGIGGRTSVCGRSGVWMMAAGCALIAAALGLWQQESRASAAATVFTISPASQVVAVDGTVTVDVSIGQVSNIANWDFRIGYDPDVLEFQSGTADRTLLQALSPACLGPAVDHTIGMVQIGCASKALDLGQYGADGSGKLATLTFKGAENGKSPLVFLMAELASMGDATGENYKIESSVTTAIVCVGDCRSPEPTPTVNPTIMTPTAPGQVRDEVPDEDPVSGSTGGQAVTPRAGTTNGSGAGVSGSGNSNSSTTGGALQGATTRSGSSSGVRGASSQGATGGSRGAAGEAFPVAGTGAAQGGAPAWPRAVVIIAGMAGAVLVAAGAATSRRKRA